MIEDIVNASIHNIISILPYKHTRIIRRNGKRIKKNYYGNINDYSIFILRQLRRFIK